MEASLLLSSIAMKLGRKDHWQFQSLPCLRRRHLAAWPRASRQVATRVTRPLSAACVQRYGLLLPKGIRRNPFGRWISAIFSSTRSLPKPATTNLPTNSSILYFDFWQRVQAFPSISLQNATTSFFPSNFYSCFLCLPIWLSALVSGPFHWTGLMIYDAWIDRMKALYRYLEGIQ